MATTFEGSALQRKLRETESDRERRQRQALESLGGARRLGFTTGGSGTEGRLPTAPPPPTPIEEPTAQPITPASADEGIHPPESARDPPRAKFSARDIAFRESFAGEPIPEGKISPAGFLDIKTTGFLGGVSERFEETFSPLFPEGRVKDVLFRESDLFIKPSELGKFVIFSPAMATTSEVTGRIAGTAAKETQFFAEVTPKTGGVSKVNIIGETGAGGLKQSFVSRQFVKDIGGDAIFGKGRGISSVIGKGGKQELTGFEILGGGKTFGKGKISKEFTGDIFRVKTSKGIGEGVKSRSFIQETEKAILEPSISFPTGKVSMAKTKALPTHQLKGGKVSRITTTEDVTGVISPLGDGKFGFLGQTAKPTTRVSREGVSQILGDISIRGGIKQIQPKDITKSFIGGVSKQKTKTLPKSVQQSIAQQLGGTQTQFSKTLAKDITPILASGGVRSLGGGVTSKLETKQVTKALGVTGKTKQEVAQVSSQKDMVKSIFGTGLKTAQETKTKQVSKFVLGTPQLTIPKTEQTTKLMLGTAQISKMKQPSMPKQRAPFIPLSFPEPKPVKPRFFFPMVLPPLGYFESYREPQVKGRGFLRIPSLITRGGIPTPKISKPLAGEITGITPIYELKSGAILRQGRSRKVKTKKRKGGK